MEVAGHVVVVTGGASGMGAATAQHLARLGAKVAVLDIHLEAAQVIAEMAGGFAVACDVADEKSMGSAMQAVVKHFGAIHIAVSCAGIAPAARIVGRDGPIAMEDFERVIRINLLGTFHCMRAAAAIMMQQDTLNADDERGVIINTASVAAFEGQIGQAAYSASKGGVVALTLPAAREFGAWGIRVMTIAPGVMETPMMAGISEEYAEGLAESVTFPSRLGHANEYASLVQTIVENHYLNGSVIRLDGGLRMAAR